MIVPMMVLGLSKSQYTPSESAMHLLLDITCKVRQSLYYYYNYYQVYKAVRMS